MKLFVAIKQVPDTETRIKLNGNKIDFTAVKWVMNPYDEYAVEAAVQLKEKNAGSTVTVVTVGPSRAAEVLRTALAMGADEGIHVESNEDLDPYQTALALARTLQAEGGAELLFTGQLAIDDNSFSVGQMTAELLGWNHVSAITKLSFEDKKVEREVEGGAKEIVTFQLPAVLTANKGLNTPRYASLPGIMKAKKKTLKVIAASSLDLGPSGWVLEECKLPADKPPVKFLSGTPQEQASQLVKALRDEAKVL